MWWKGEERHLVWLLVAVDGRVIPGEVLPKGADTGEDDEFSFEHNC